MVISFSMRPLVFFGAGLLLLSAILLGALSLGRTAEPSPIDPVVHEQIQISSDENQQAFELSSIETDEEQLTEPPRPSSPDVAEDPSIIDHSINGGNYHVTVEDPVLVPENQFEPEIQTQLYEESLPATLDTTIQNDFDSSQLLPEDSIVPEPSSVYASEHQSEPIRVDQNVHVIDVDQTTSDASSTITESSSDTKSGIIDESNVALRRQPQVDAERLFAVAHAIDPGYPCNKDIICVSEEPSELCFARQHLCLQREGHLNDAEKSSVVQETSQQNQQSKDKPRYDDQFEFDSQYLVAQAAAVSSVVYLWPGLLTALAIIGYNVLQQNYNLAPLRFRSTFGPAVCILFLTSTSLMGWIFINSINNEAENMIQHDIARRAFASNALDRYCAPGREREIPQPLFDSLDLFGKPDCHRIMHLVHGPTDRINYIEAMSRVIASGRIHSVHTIFGTISGVSFFVFWAFSTILTTCISLIALVCVHGAEKVIKSIKERYNVEPAPAAGPAPRPPQTAAAAAPAAVQGRTPPRIVHIGGGDEQTPERPFRRLKRETGSRDVSAAPSDSEADSPSTASKGSRSSTRIRKATTRMDL